MMNIIDTIITDSDSALPFKHKVGKFMIGGIVGLAASHFAEKGYDLALECYRKRKSIVK
jgi:hypothetical protein